MFEDVLEGEAGILQAALEGAGADVELAGYVVALDLIGKQFKKVGELAVSQATQLQELRDRGIID